MQTLQPVQLLALLLVGISFGFMVLWTLGIIGKYLCFYVKGMKGEDTSLSPKLYFKVALSYGVFFVALKIYNILFP